MNENTESPEVRVDKTINTHTSENSREIDHRHEVRFHEQLEGTSLFKEAERFKERIDFLKSEDYPRVSPRNKSEALTLMCRLRLSIRRLGQAMILMAETRDIRLKDKTFDKYVTSSLKAIVDKNDV